MKRVWWFALIALWTTTGCLNPGGRHSPKIDRGKPLPEAPQTVTSAKVPTVKAEQITEANAHEMAKLLAREIERDMQVAAVKSDQK